MYMIYFRIDKVPPLLLHLSVVLLQSQSKYCAIHISYRNVLRSPHIELRQSLRQSVVQRTLSEEKAVCIKCVQALSNRSGFFNIYRPTRTKTKQHGTSKKYI